MDDPILFWNAVSLDCNRRDHTGVMAARNRRGPTLSSRALAIVHIAMRDAYVLTRAGLGTPVTKNDPYFRPRGNRPSHAGGSTTATAASAVAAASSVALLNLYPSLGGFIGDEHARFSGMWGGDEAGHRFGSAVGQEVIALRQGAARSPILTSPSQITYIRPLMAGIAWTHSIRDRGSSARATAMFVRSQSAASIRLPNIQPLAARHMLRTILRSTPRAPPPRRPWSTGQRWKHWLASTGPMTA